jgi:hypothetical protein
MVTKSEMIEFIQQNSDETESWGDLNRMKKSEVSKIYDYLIKLKTIQEVEESDEIKSTVTKKVKIDPSTVQEYVEHQIPSELSIAEQRAFARTGVLPKVKKNKYNRFDDEDVKFGF